jgi:hypothetical protein
MSTLFDAPLGFDCPAVTPEERRAAMLNRFPAPWRAHVDENGDVFLVAATFAPGEVPPTIAFFGDMEETDMSDHEALALCALAPSLHASLSSLLPLARSVLAGCAPDTPEARQLAAALDEAEALLNLNRS